MRRPITLLVALTLATTACTAAPREDARDDTTPPPFRPVLLSSLSPFQDCGDLLSHLQRHGAEQAQAMAQGQRAMDGPFFGSRRDLAEATSEAPAAAPRAAADDGGKAAAGAPAFSGTNVQEAGVDEPDLVKTDGRRLLTVSAGRLWSVRPSPDSPQVLDSLELPAGGATDLLLAGDRALLLSVGSASPLARGDVGGSARRIAPDQPADLGGIAPVMVERATLTLVDVSDPGDLRVLETFEADGRVLTARMRGDVARVVVRTTPTVSLGGFLPPPDPTSVGRAVEEDAATGTGAAGPVEGDTAGGDTAEALRATSLEDWLPSYRAVAADGRSRSGLLARCDRVARPAEFSGLGTLSVLTFDLGDGLGSGDAVSVVADGEVVYASENGLYVATNRWSTSGTSKPEAGAADDPVAPVVSAQSTEIHKFDVSGEGPARHVASGAVRGHLLNQFSMSEHEGHLRVATTDTLDDGRGVTDAVPSPDPGSPALRSLPVAPAPSTESFVSVLADREGRLVEVGQVGGLGKGERIYAVRFLGDVGYVVTFRQTDPLYTLDLSEPTRPSVVGELKINGYSAYLHPLGEGLVLGVGQDATAEGRRLGTQVSLFDVSDPARPLRLHQHPLGSGSSEAEYDHHAFLWWAPSRLAVLPVQTYDMSPDGRSDRSFTGAVGLSVDRQGGIAEVGRVTHPADGATFAPEERKLAFANSLIRRSVVIGDTLYTLSDAGLLTSAVESLRPGAFLRLAP